MTNAEKYKTAKERAEAFRKHHEEHYHECRDTPYVGDAINRCVMCLFNWLDLEAPAEKPLPCPFCGCKVQVVHDTQAIAVKAKWLINCYGCNYEFGAETKEALIAAHNRVARAAKEVSHE